MRLVLAFGILASLAGCNSGIDQQSANKVTTSALTGIGVAHQQLVPSGGASNGSFDGTIQNPAGSGSAHVVGSATQTANGWDVSVDITFDKWTDAASNITLDGALHEKASFTTMKPFVGNIAVTGTLTASGALQAAVDFDVTASYSPTQAAVSGHVGGDSINFSLTL